MCPRNLFGPNKLYNFFIGLVNLTRAKKSFQAMGYESDHLIATTVGIEEEYIAAIGPTIDECALLNIISRADAIKYLIPRIRRKTFGSIGVRVSQEHDVLDFLSNSMICHILSPEGNMKMKAIYIGLMIRRFL